MDQHSQDSVLHRPAPIKPKQPKIEPTPPMMLEYLDRCSESLIAKVDAWRDTCSNKLSYFDVYGYVIRGTTINNATKRLRKFQAESNLQPGITRDELETERKRLKALIKKTTQTK